MTKSGTVNTHLTRDHFFGGKLRIYQPKVGYRTSMDGCLLVDFISRSKPVQDSIEFGIGTGMIGIGIVLTKWTKKLTGIEMNKSYATLAVQNVEENGQEENIDVLCGDLRDRDLVKNLCKTDAVIMNPPFWDLENNQMPKNIDRRISDHEISGSLKEWLVIATKLFKNKRSRVFFIYPAGKIAKCCEFLRAASLSMERIRFVHSHFGNRAELIMVEARRSRNAYVNIESPLFLKDNQGHDTEESANILRGEFSKEIAKLADRRELI